MRNTLREFYLQHGYHIYDYLSRVPFIVTGMPGWSQTKNVNSEVRNIDILPTLCEALKLKTPEVNWHGASFHSLITNGKSESRPLYMETRGGAQAVHAFYVRGVRSAGYKLAEVNHAA